MCGGSEQKPQIKEEWSSGSFEQKPQINEEWSSGSFPFKLKPDSINVDEEAIEKSTLKDITYWNGDSDPEDKSDYNNTGRHLPSTLGCGRSLNTAGPHVPPWPEEALTFRAVLQHRRGRGTGTPCIPRQHTHPKQHACIPKQGRTHPKAAQAFRTAAYISVRTASEICCRQIEALQYFSVFVNVCTLISYKSALK